MIQIIQMFLKPISLKPMSNMPLKTIPLPKTKLPLGGFIAEGYQPVLDAFVDNFENHQEIGAAITVYHKEQKVIDLWGGYENKETQSPWKEDSMIVVFSATKGIAAFCLLMLADRGQLDYEQKVSYYWPNFAKNGKEAITVRQLLSHTSGLSAIENPLTLKSLATDSGKQNLREALEAQRPLFPPGSAQGYNAISFGAYAAELFKQVTGEEMAEFYQREIQAPLNADFWIGNADTQKDRVAKLYQLSTGARLRKMLWEIIKGGSTESRVGRAFLKSNSIVKKAFLNPSMGPLGPEVYNSELAQTTPMWWGGGFASARGLAQLYVPLANKGSHGEVQLLKAETLESVYPRKSWSQQDLVVGKALGWNQGFLKEETSIFSPNKESFGHAGMGGTLGWADPKENLAIAYVMNSMDHRIRSPRALRLCHALYQSEAVLSSSK